MTFEQIRSSFLISPSKCGWPSLVLDEWSRQQSRVAPSAESPGPTAAPGRSGILEWPNLRISNGEKCFATINLVPYPGARRHTRTAAF